MASVLTPAEVWSNWSEYLIPYFQKCEKSLIYSIVQEIVSQHAVNYPRIFQEQLAALLISQATEIINKSESIETVTYTFQSFILNNDSNLAINEPPNINNQSPRVDIRWIEYTQNSKYLISDDGRVYSTYTKKELSLFLRSGYYSVGLHRNGIHKIEFVHRLVAICFVSNPDPTKLTIVNHKDHNKLNNSYLNLEWVTPHGNSIHSVTRESYKPSGFRPVHRIDSSGLIVQTFESITDASKQTGVNAGRISDCCRNIYDRSFNASQVEYKWRYVDEVKIDEMPTNAKPINNFPNYLVTRDGRIYSLNKRGYLSQQETSDGYLTVRLSGSMTKKHYYVHRLVASAYLIVDPFREIVNHIDSDPRNNHVDNLQYVTSQENAIHSSEQGNNMRLGKPVKMIDPISKICLRTFSSTREASRATNIHRENISVCCNNKSRLAGGYLWQFEDEIGIRELRPKITRACPVEQLDLNTRTVVTRYPSMKEAAQSIEGITKGISDVCRGKRSEYKGWFWRTV